MLVIGGLEEGRTMAAPISKFLCVKSYKYSDQHTAEVLPAYHIAKEGLSFNPTYKGKPKSSKQSVAQFLVYLQ